MSTLRLPVHDTERPPSSAVELVTVDRFSSVLKNHRVFVWRMLRRFGVAHARVDEAVSRVFDVFSRKADAVVAGKERAFLVQVSAKVASEFRRSDSRRTRVEELARPAYTTAPTPEELLADSEERAMLDAVLLQLDDGPREVFVLHELEGFSCPVIGEMLGIATGTASSRLRRGRKQFEEAAARLRAMLDAEAAGTTTNSFVAMLVAVGVADSPSTAPIGTSVTHVAYGASHGIAAPSVSMAPHAIAFGAAPAKVFVTAVSAVAAGAVAVSAAVIPPKLATASAAPSMAVVAPGVMDTPAAKITPTRNEDGKSEATESIDVVALESLPTVTVGSREPAPRVAKYSSSHDRPSGSASAGRSAQPSLSEEVLLVGRAMRLAKSAPAQALALLDEHARRFPQPSLADEATLARFQALLASGRHDEADVLADAVFESRGGTPLAARVRSALASENTSPDGRP